MAFCIADSWDFSECLSVLIYTLAVGTAYLYLIWRLAAFLQTALCSKSSSINYARDTVWIFNVASRLSLSLLTLGPYSVEFLFPLFLCVLLLISLIVLVRQWIHCILFLFSCTLLSNGKAAVCTSHRHSALPSQIKSADYILWAMCFYLLFIVLLLVYILMSGSVQSERTTTEKHAIKPSHSYT